jgi:CheY-like chemotaxis protein
MARILVVEDDPMNSRLFDLILSRKGGHKVVIAKDAEDAVRLGTNGSFNLIIMDVSLQNWVYEGQEITGIDLTKIIRRINPSQKAPILLATAFAMTNDRENLLRESGAEDYFAKPIQDYDLFLSMVKSLIESPLAGKNRTNGKD